MNHPLGLDPDELARVARGLEDEAKQQAEQDQRAHARIMERLDNGEPIAVWMYGECKKRGLSHDEIMLELARMI